jgi:hypothetical protein
MNILDELMNNIKTFFESNIKQIKNNATDCNIIHLVDYLTDNKKNGCCIPPLNKSTKQSTQNRHLSSGSNIHKNKYNNSKYTSSNILNCTSVVSSPKIPVTDLNQCKESDKNVRLYKIKLNNKKYKLKNMKIKI